MATYKNYSIGGVMYTQVSQVADRVGHSKANRQTCQPRKNITMVDITVWGMGRSAGCAGNNGIAMREGAEVTMSR